ncbi:MAG: prepilin peptidase [Christensenellales bacterium]
MIEIIYIMTAILGLCVGSFLNVVIYRVPNKMSVVKPASHCPNCNKEIKWYDNIPILSYFILGGKCRNCKAYIPIRYTLIEIGNAVLWLLCLVCFYRQGIVLSVLMMFVCSVLLIVACIDFEHMIIFDRFQIVLFVLGVLMCIFCTDISFVERIIGFFVGGGIMLLFYGLGYLLFKKEALGIGDIKLMAVCGLIIGYKNIILAILIGAIIGAVVLSILNRKEKNKEYPFAPFLCFGVIVALFVGNLIINAYLSLF